MILKLTKISLVLALLSTTALGQSQQTNDLQLPKLLPPTPNASELGKYGSIPISLSTGMINVSIPLATVQSGALKLGVELGYSSGGIKVDQMASRAGLGWVLQSGGVINRTVYGDRDEASTYAPIPSTFDPSNATAREFLERVTLNKDGHDSQPDIFNFSFNGYSGKFILDPADRSHVIFLTKTALKIAVDFSGTAWNLKVTDPNGIVYYFGGSSATEKSRSTSSGTSCGKTYDQYVANAWYLTKIADLNGDEINLDYLPVTFSYNASASQNVVAQTPETRAQILQHANVTVYPAPGYQSNCVTTIQNTGVLLNRILSSKGAQIQFTYTTRNDVAGDYLVSKLEYGQTGSSYLKTFNFTYNQVLSDLSYTAGNTNVENNYRPYLTTVSELSSDLSMAKTHRFNYYNPAGLPPRMAYAQDHFGFFNGQHNTGFLPSPEVSDVFNYTPSDRETHGEYAHYGMLSSVRYPTGGRDSVLFEPNTIEEHILEHTISTPLSTILNVEGTGARNSVSTVSDITLDHTQTIHAYVEATYSGTGVDDRIHQRTDLEIRNLTTQQVIFTRSILIDELYNTDIVDVPSGNYRVTLTSVGQATRGHGFVNYQSGSQTIPEQYNFKVTGGVRVKSVFTIDNVTGQQQIKSYSYNKLATPAHSSGVLLRPVPSYFSTTEMVVYNPSPPTGLFSYYVLASSSSNISLYAQDGNHMMYTEVVENDGLDLNNGGTYHKYLVVPDALPILVLGNKFPQMPYGMSGRQSVLEDYQLVFRQPAGQPMTKLKESFVRWKHILQGSVVGYLGRKNYDVPATNPVGRTGENPYDLASYTIQSFWNYSDSTKTISYDQNGSNPVVSLEESFYENPNHLQLTRSSTTLSDQSTRITRLYYPEDMINQSQDPGGVYAAMVSVNKIAPVIHTKEFRGNNLIRGKRTNYYAPYTNIFVPQSVDVYNTVSAAYETRIVFNRYSPQGDVLSFSQAGGTPTNYIWSYNGEYPVAEIRNADYSSVENLLGASTITGFRNSFPDKTAVDNLVSSLKANLPAAQISTFSYLPLIGMASQTDAKGMTTYYNYDTFQRLKNVKDQQGNIVKDNTYHYQP